MKTTLMMTVALLSVSTTAFAECVHTMPAGHQHGSHHETAMQTPDCCKGMEKPCCPDMAKDASSEEPCHHMAPKADAHKGHEDGHNAHGSGVKGHDNASTRSYVAGMDTMHKAMDITYTGDSDIDFLRGMIAHHEGAVDMAETVLQYGKDAQVRRMAKDVIRAQNQEIAFMKTWLAQLESNGVKVSADDAKPSRWSDKGWSGDTWMGER